MKEIHIEQKKKRYFKIGIMASFFLVLSIIFIVFPSIFLSKTINSKVFVVVSGVLGTLFFGLVSLYNWRKYLNSKLGIYIGEQGVLDLTSVFRFGWIEWEDIVGFKSHTVKGVPMIFIEVKEIEKYLNRLKSPILLKAAQNYQNAYQTPLFMSVKSLSKTQAEIEKILNTELKKRK